VKSSAKRKIDNSVVFADYVKKENGPFYCPECLSEAIVRLCSEKKNHFAHKSRQSPIILSKDQKLHNQCRDEICVELKNVFPDGKWETERTIPVNKNKGTKERIPDISGRINGKPIAIEIQFSAYTINRIYDKTVDYAKLGIAVLWIVPLREDLGNEPFRPRLFEKYLHSLYFGKLFYYTVGSKTKLNSVHFSPAKRWIKENEWYEEDATHRVEGGFYLTYKTVKIPNYGETVDLTTDFFVIENNGYTPKNAKKEIPKCSVFSTKQKKWWNKNEYRDLKNQVEVIKQKKLFPEYNPEDDYDDYDNHFIDDNIDNE
jgi:competence protein CoiA